MKTTISLIPASEALQAFPEMIGHLVAAQLPARHSSDATHEHEITLDVRRLTPPTPAKRGPKAPRATAGGSSPRPGRPPKSATT